MMRGQSWKCLTGAGWLMGWVAMSGVGGESFGMWGVDVPGSQTLENGGVIEFAYGAGEGVDFRYHSAGGEAPPFEFRIGTPQLRVSTPVKFMAHVDAETLAIVTALEKGDEALSLIHLGEGRVEPKIIGKVFSVDRRGERFAFANGEGEYFVNHMRVFPSALEIERYEGRRALARVGGELRESSELLGEHRYRALGPIWFKEDGPIYFVVRDLSVRERGARDRRVELRPTPGGGGGGESRIEVTEIIDVFGFGVSDIPDYRQADDPADWGRPLSRRGHTMFALPTWRRKGDGGE